MKDRLISTLLMILVGATVAYFTDSFVDRNQSKLNETYEFKELEKKVDEKLSKVDFLAYKEDQKTSRKIEADYNKELRELIIDKFADLNKRIDDIKK
ncbi:MAG: hypothetical protein OEL54_06405 [Flavobacteriaceae bacterium]|nr:hypothetical protein [Flavobacteriaceae bacterium]